MSTKILLQITLMGAPTLWIGGECNMDRRDSASTSLTPRSQRALCMCINLMSANRDVSGTSLKYKDRLGKADSI
jgi:hypothetical protein